MIVPPPPRRVLLLQGPRSPFFARLADALAARGAGVARVLFCPGDELFWLGRPALRFRGARADWPDFLRAALARTGATDVVGLGDGRWQHAQAFAAARAAGLGVHVVEQGYLRPGWLTVEPDALGAWRPGAVAAAGFAPDVGPASAAPAGEGRAAPADARTAAVARPCAEGPMMRYDARPAWPGGGAAAARPTTPAAVPGAGGAADRGEDRSAAGGDRRRSAPGEAPPNAPRGTRQPAPGDAPPHARGAAWPPAEDQPEQPGAGETPPHGRAGTPPPAPGQAQPHGRGEAQPQAQGDAAWRPAPPPAPPGAPFAVWAAMDVAWDAANLIGGPLLYPRFRTHAATHPVAEWAGWLRRAAGAPARRAARAAALARLADHRGPLFLFALQLETDFMIRDHGPAGGLPAACAAVTAAFAAAAPPDALLAVKPHPLDPGLTDWAGLTAGPRRVYLDGGDLDVLLARAAGVVTVNSTVGLTALRRGKAVAALGRAVYAPLTHAGPLAAFFRRPTPPDPHAVAAFVAAMAAEIQTPGGFDGPAAAVGAAGVAELILRRGRP